MPSAAPHKERYTPARAHTSAAGAAAKAAHTCASAANAHTPAAAARAHTPAARAHTPAAKAAHTCASAANAHTPPAAAQAHTPAQAHTSAAAEAHTCPARCPRPPTRQASLHSPTNTHHALAPRPPASKPKAAPTTARAISSFLSFLSGHQPASLTQSAHTRAAQAQQPCQGVARQAPPKNRLRAISRRHSGCFPAPARETPVLQAALPQRKYPAFPLITIAAQYRNNMQPAQSICSNRKSKPPKAEEISMRGGAESLFFSPSRPIHHPDRPSLSFSKPF